MSVGQLAAKLQAVKVGDDLIVRDLNPGHTRVVRGGPRGRIFFRSPILTACSFAVI